MIICGYSQEMFDRIERWPAIQEDARINMVSKRSLQRFEIESGPRAALARMIGALELGSRERQLLPRQLHRRRVGKLTFTNLIGPEVNATNCSTGWSCLSCCLTCRRRGKWSARADQRRSGRVFGRG